MMLRLVVLLTLGFAATSPAQQGQHPYYSEWDQIMPRYGQDPVATKEDVIALGRKGTKDLPGVALIVLGDAYLREGDYARAARAFERALLDPASQSVDVLKATPGHYAQIGLGMAKVGTGRLDDARAAFSEAATAGGDLGQLAALADAQTAAAMGDHDEALDLLDELATREGLEPSVADAAQLARAGSLLAAGHHAEAAEAFEALTRKEGPFRDAALYASALARLMGGEASKGREALEAMAATCPKTPEGEAASERPSRGMRQLAPRAVLLQWIRSYRESGFDIYTSGSADLLSFDGCALALETLERLSTEPAAVSAAPRAAPEPQIDDIATVAPIATAAPAPEPTVKRTAAAAEATERGASWLTVLVLVAGAVIGIAALVRLMRRG